MGHKEILQGDSFNVFSNFIKKGLGGDYKVKEGRDDNFDRVLRVSKDDLTSVVWHGPGEEEKETVVAYSFDRVTDLPVPMPTDLKDILEAKYGEAKIDEFSVMRSTIMVGNMWGNKDVIAVDTKVMRTVFEAD